MQKKLIVLAIAALASTSAFADSTVYGVVDGAVANVSGTNVKGQLLALSGGLAASRVGLKTAEDLDGGLKAVAVLEYGLDTETSTGLSAATARQQLLGVAGGFGTVATGYLQTVAYDWAKLYDPLGGSVVSSLQNVTGSTFLLGQKGNAVRAPRALAYISPDFSGLSFAVNYSTALAGGLGDAATATSAKETNVTAALLGVNYTAGALNVSLAYANTSNPAGAAATSGLNQSEYGVGASYDFGIAKVLASYQANTNGAAYSTTGVANTSITNSAYSLSAVVPVGADAVAVQYAANSLTQSGQSTNTVAKPDTNTSPSATGYSVAYLHPMSKTTTAYAAYSSVINGSTAANYSVANNVYGATGLTAAGASSTVIALGLNKKF